MNKAVQNERNSGFQQLLTLLSRIPAYRQTSAILLMFFEKFVIFIIPNYQDNFNQISTSQIIIHRFAK